LFLKQIHGTGEEIGLFLKKIHGTGEEIGLLLKQIHGTGEEIGLFLEKVHLSAGWKRGIRGCDDRTGAHDRKNSKDIELFRFDYHRSQP
jgi:hypothetical protein